MLARGWQGAGVGNGEAQPGSLGEAWSWATLLMQNNPSKCIETPPAGAFHFEADAKSPSLGERLAKPQAASGVCRLSSIFQPATCRETAGGPCRALLLRLVRAVVFLAIYF